MRNFNVDDTLVGGEARAGTAGQSNGRQKAKAKGKSGAHQGVLVESDGTAFEDVSNMRDSACEWMWMKGRNCLCVVDKADGANRSRWDLKKIWWW